jgi:hypothetical protein
MIRILEAGWRLNIPAWVVATRKRDGWVKSTVFTRSFRLLVHKGPGGKADYPLEVR